MCQRYWCVGQRYLERSDQLCPPRQRGEIFLKYQLIAERAYMKINTLYLSLQNSPFYAFTSMNVIYLRFIVKIIIKKKHHWPFASKMELASRRMFPPASVVGLRNIQPSRVFASFLPHCSSRRPSPYCVSRSCNSSKEPSTSNSTRYRLTLRTAVNRYNSQGRN